jgi:hypothetical protein
LLSEHAAWIRLAGNIKLDFPDFEEGPLRQNPSPQLEEGHQDLLEQHLKINWVILEEVWQHSLFDNEQQQFVDILNPKPTSRQDLIKDTYTSVFYEDFTDFYN